MLAVKRNTNMMMDKASQKEAIMKWFEENQQEEENKGAAAAGTGAAAEEEAETMKTMMETMMEMVGHIPAMDVKVEEEEEEKKVYRVKETPAFVQTILKKHNGKDNAAMVINMNDIKQKMLLWNTLFPRVQPFYAVKCNPNPHIINVLHQGGAHFDCASPAEIAMVKKIIKGDIESLKRSSPQSDDEEDEESMMMMERSESISSLSTLSSYSSNTSLTDVRDVIFEPTAPLEKIIYANPCKTKNAIRFAARENVNWLVVDSVEELMKVYQEFPKAKIFVRILVDDSSSMCQFGKKFGLNPQSTELDNVLNAAKTYNIHLEGVSFHVGSGCSSAEAYRGALTHVKSVFEQAKKKGIHTMRVVDIGGGFPGENMALLEAISVVVNDCIDTLFDNNVAFMAEPGRYFVTTSHTLICQIGTKKCIDGVTRYYLNDGVYCSFNNILHDHYEPLLHVVNSSPLDATRTHRASVFGPTCDSIDTIYTNVDLPIMECDSHIYFENMGAYTNAAGTNFNGFDFPSLYYI